MEKIQKIQKKETTIQLQVIQWEIQRKDEKKIHMKT